MRKRLFAVALTVLVASVVGLGWNFAAARTGEAIEEAAMSFLSLLEKEQLATATMPFDDPRRLDWHFIPKAERKGLQIRDMSEPQRQAAAALLRSVLSEVGYEQATQIIALEGLLAELEQGRQGGPIRDSQRYYYTIFGDPAGDAAWGLSIEGHHLSLNFVLREGEVLSSTPAFFAANPATVKTKNEAGFELGTRVLADEEQLAFDLVAALSPEQKAAAVIAAEAPADIRGPADAKPPADEGVGLPASELTDAQAAILRQLINAYAEAMPASVATARLDALEAAGFDKIRFAWAGADKPGVGHYYRVQGPTFLIEFVNVQPDAAGNPANHIHCVWRDMQGDFGLTAE